jgi:hypothetical protein
LWQKDLNGSERVQNESTSAAEAASIFSAPMARLKACPDTNLRGEGQMPSHPSKPKTLAGDPRRRDSLRDAGATVVFRSLQSRSA